MVGLGKMGGNMVVRLLGGGHEVVAYARTRSSVEKAAQEGAEPAHSLQQLVHALVPPRIVWLMIPAGAPTEETLGTLKGLLAPGDIVVDGGNSEYRDTIRRAQEMEALGIRYLDAGTSGGIWGLKVGYCLMVGGDAAAVAYVEPIFRTLAPENGYLHVGPAGAGHFVKMVHNGIEYGLLEAYAEGFEILEDSKFDLDLVGIADLWNHGSVVRSWLLELGADALRRDPNLGSIEGFVEDSGEGRWTVEESIRLGVPAPVIALSLMARFRSRQTSSFGAKFIAALRNEFGGHAVRRAAHHGAGSGKA